MAVAGGRSPPLEEFTLYETRSKFYLVGRDISRTHWRVLEIDRSNPSKLNIKEDPTTYTERGWKQRLQTRNILRGGPKFVTECYGMAGFFKFLGPYYMVFITERKNIGTICGHTIYSVSKTEMIALDKSSNQTKIPSSKDENRYKQLLCNVDLTKDFFFSYSYNIMNTLQKNLSNGETGQALYESMFVWNKYLTHAIRDHLNTARWTVALAHGFFEQAKLSILGKGYIFTLIARRSRHYAGPRYLKRGINEKGKAANHVETEQIIFEDTPEMIPTRITSVVQCRGSIPLYWSQKISGLNVKPDIILHQMDDNFKATKLHFEDLVDKYGNPIIVLNLIRAHDKPPRESILHSEFEKAVNCINEDLSDENNLRFLHLDIHKESQKRNANELASLGKEAAVAFDSTGFFYCQIPPALRNQDALILPIFLKDHSGEWLYSSQESREDLSNHLAKSPKLQHGVLRTNCIDSLDRTNVAQYAYGLIALGHQLHALGFIETVKIGEDDQLAKDLMDFYERMGNTLALQYAGSPAHNQIFNKKRGQWKVSLQLEKAVTAFLRYCSHAFTDEQKQDALDVFLGHFQPQRGQLSLWNLASDERATIRRDGSAYAEEVKRTFMKRSYSDSYIIWEGESNDVSGNQTPTSTYGDAQISEFLSHPKPTPVANADDRRDSSESEFSDDDEDDEPEGIVMEQGECSRTPGEGNRSGKNTPAIVSDGEELDIKSEQQPDDQGGGSTVTPWYNCLNPQSWVPKEWMECIESSWPWGIKRSEQQKLLSQT